MSRITLVLADDQVLFVESLKIVIETRSSDIEIAGIAHNGEEAVKLVEKVQPDLVLMDVKMPKTNGVEATKIIHQKFPDIKILMLTTFDDKEYVSEALNYGAVGYILKNIPPYELINSIHAAFDGGSFLLSPVIAERLIGRTSESAAKRPSTGEMSHEKPPWIEALTVREKELLCLLAEGYDNKRISERLFLAEQTVRNKISFLYSKLDVHTRLDAIRKLRAMSIEEICE